MPSMNKFEFLIKRIVKKNKWSQTPNVTLLESVKKILKATDKWRRKYPNREVVEDILESVFFLLSTCASLDHNVNLDSLLLSICEGKENFSFKDMPDDLVWTFLIYETVPHIDYTKKSQLHLNEPTAK